MIMSSDNNVFKAVGTEFRVPDQKLVSCGDVSCEFLVDPIPRPTPPTITAVYKPRKWEVVLIDSAKPNSITVMEATQRILRERGIPVQDTIRVKYDASNPMPDAQMEEVAQEEGLIICGIND